MRAPALPVAPDAAAPRAGPFFPAGRVLVGCAPGSVWPTKALDAGGFAAAVAALARRSALCRPRRARDGAREAIRARSGGRPPCSPGEPIPTLVAVIDAWTL